MGLDPQSIVHIWIQTLPEKLRKTLQMMVNHAPNISQEGTWNHREWRVPEFIIQLLNIAEMCMEVHGMNNPQRGAR